MKVNAPKDPFKSNYSKLGNLFASLSGYDFKDDATLGEMDKATRIAEMEARDKAKRRSVGELMSYLSDSYFGQDASANLTERSKLRKENEDELARLRRISAMVRMDPGISQDMKNQILSSKEGLLAYEKEKFKFGPRDMYSNLKTGVTLNNLNKKQFENLMNLPVMQKFSKVTYQDYLDDKITKEAINEVFSQTYAKELKEGVIEIGANQREVDLMRDIENIDSLEAIIEATMKNR